VNVEPLDFAGPWPYPWSRLSQIALEADLEVDELRAYLEREVERTSLQRGMARSQSTALNEKTGSLLNASRTA
jgi:hypothetical protein